MSDSLSLDYKKLYINIDCSKILRGSTELRPIALSASNYLLIKKLPYQITITANYAEKKEAKYITLQKGVTYMHT